MPKRLEGGNELIITHQDLSGTGEDHRALRRLLPIVLQRQGQKIKNWVKNQIPLPAPNQTQKHPKKSPNNLRGRRKVPRTIQEREKAKKIGTDLVKRVHDHQIGAFSHGKCLQYGQDAYGIHSQRAGEDEQDLSTQIIEEIQFFKSSIDAELGKFDAKLDKITSDISELKKRNHKKYAEW
ncbi:hypothetical protein O181_082425 [Austropuccinia psidii MF-1]|uniref:Uncharacterized protein n=1 Tax=Austropuccinia psidii MF-1 TaxID=1389203 RepID=A0A9Q3IKU6_9BASI|nr:hypothetical protein [Austropuccinia psidii MF-1]